VLLVTHHDAARTAIFATIAAGLVLEVLATLARRGGLREALGVPSGSVLDRGTKHVLVVLLVGGVVASTFIARVPSLRARANTWLTYGIGLGVLAAGIALRLWAVWSLGRYFRREVTIEPGQTVHRTGPYRFVRHPAYSGDILIAAGFGLAWGSWVGAAVALVLALAGHLPRIRVEEAELQRAFGESYASYARGRARLVPGVW
jgi:protein-S-isoprenylcysteine O-methyltransferase Ste14